MVKECSTKNTEWSDEEFEETKLRKKQVENDDLDVEALIRRMSLDRKNKIFSFEELGLFDPFEDNSVSKALQEVNQMKFSKEIYPDYIMGPLIRAVHQKNSIQHPKCIFVPDRQVCRKIIKALIRFGDTESSTEFFLRFGLVE